MPASSRKRNKGKDRKARQQAKREEKERLDAHRFWRNALYSVGCDHGYDVRISNDHPVSEFMDQFIINLDDKGMGVSVNMRNLFETHAQIWTTESYRKLALSILTNIGINMLLGNGKEIADISWPGCIAQSIALLEHYDGTSDINSVMFKRVASVKRRDLDLGLRSIKRDAFKFYRKRTSCKCLKKIHLEARKTIPKLGTCFHCDKEMDRVSLSVCSRCMVHQYCSRKCQVAVWPDHKRNCDIYVQTVTAEVSFKWDNKVKR